MRSSRRVAASVASGGVVVVEALTRVGGVLRVELGAPFSNTQLTPFQLPSVDAVDSIGVGRDFSCLVRRGQVLCWGRNDSRQLGNGSTDRSTTPVAVAGITDAVSVWVGLNRACAVRAGGGVRCWGTGMGGSEISGLSTVRQVALGETFTCALLADRTVQCWGSNNNGQLGNGSIGGSSATPAAVTTLTDVAQIVARNSVACARTNGGVVSCWGAGTSGLLRATGTADSATPLVISGIAGAVDLSLGSTAACAVIDDGTVRCWGNGSNGSLGGTTDHSSTPVTVIGVTNATLVSAGSGVTCAVLRDRRVICWGGRFRGDSTGSYYASAAPMGLGSVTPLRDAVAISVGYEFACARTVDGLAHCWGADLWGWFGTGAGLTPFNVQW